MAESNREEIAKLEAIYANNPGGRVFTHLAEAYRKAGELSRARSILETGIGRHPDYASAYVVLGRVLIDQGALQDAATSFQRVLELDPENRVALRTVGDLARVDRPSVALNHYRQLQSLDPSDEELAQLITDLEEQLQSSASAGPVETRPETQFARPSAAGATAAAPPAQAVGPDFSLDWSAAEPPPDEYLPGDIEELSRHEAVEAVGEPPAAAPAEAVAEPLPKAEPVAPAVPEEIVAAEGEPAELAASSAGQPESAPPIDEPLWSAPIEPEPILPASAPEPTAAEFEPTFEGLLTADLGADSPFAEGLEEPASDLPTETLADLYRTQGVYQRSIEIYRALLETRPGDQRLRQKLEEVEELERAATIEPVSGLTLDLDATLADEMAFLDVSEPINVAGDVFEPAAEPLVEKVESAWTDGGGAADVAHPPYAWELEHEEDVSGPTLQEYLAGVLSWRPVAPPPPVAEDVAPSWDDQADESQPDSATWQVEETEPDLAAWQPEESQRDLTWQAEELQPDLSTWVAPESELVVEREATSWEEPAEVEPWENPEAASEASPEAEPWLMQPTDIAEADVEPWLPPLASVNETEAEPWVTPVDEFAPVEDLAPVEDFGPTDEFAPTEDDPWLRVPEDTTPLPGLEPEPDGPVGVQDSAGGGVNDAFEEWFTETPQTAPPAQPAGAAIPETAPESESVQSEETSDEESDDDLEMFRSWLQSLKR